MSALPNSQRLKIAIVGSGPSGFYAAEALLGSGKAAVVDIFDRLPVPFGLVRYGVAPDHQKLKQVTAVFTKIAGDPRVRFFGSIEIGKALPISELAGHYHAVIVACGASSDRKMGIANEDLPGSHSAVDFVGWYNGHPDYRHLTFDLSGDHAVIVGQGNVAIDVCRILAKPVDELAKTDIARHALETLTESRVRTITVAGRRGPAQAKFTTKELRELGELPGWDVHVDKSDLELNPVSAGELADPKSISAAKNLEILREFSVRPKTRDRRIHLLFHAAPHSIEGFGFAGSITFERTKLEGEMFQQKAAGTGAYLTLETAAVFRSVGYAGVPFPELPFNERTGTIANTEGRVAGKNGSALPGIYVTGWIKRGPTGIIGTNRVDSIATVSRLLEDMRDPQTDKTGDIADILRNRGQRWTTFSDWQAIDRKELADGHSAGCIRRKIVEMEELRAFATGGADAPAMSDASP